MISTEPKGVVSFYITANMIFVKIFYKIDFYIDKYNTKIIIKVVDIVKYLQSILKIKLFLSRIAILSQKLNSNEITQKRINYLIN